MFYTFWLHILQQKWILHQNNGFFLWIGNWICSYLFCSDLVHITKRSALFSNVQSSMHSHYNHCSCCVSTRRVIYWKVAYYQSFGFWIIFQSLSSYILFVCQGGEVNSNPSFHGFSSPHFLSYSLKFKIFLLPKT